jgi:serine protease Do
MLNRYFLPACFVGAAVVIVIASISSQEALSQKTALEAQEVARIAKSTVVRIEPSVNSPGSGVIIGRYQEGGKNVYVVLTANHVVQYGDDEYNVVTPLPQGEGKKRQKISISTQKDIEKLPNVDLALVRFRSDRNYQVATLGESKYATEGALVYVAGFPNPGAAIKKRVFQFGASLVASRLESGEVEGEKETGIENGYSIVYNAVTRAGMSGGPVFDASGRVIGIHGQGDREVSGIIGNETTGSNQESGSSSGRTSEKTGRNLGIPIQTFLTKGPKNTSRLGIKLDTSAPGLFNVTIATRGGPRTQLPQPIQEEEDVSVETVNEKPTNSAPSNPNVAPQPVKPLSPEPNQPENKPNGRFF